MEQGFHKWNCYSCICCATIVLYERSRVMSENDFIRLYYVKDKDVKIVIIDLLTKHQSHHECSEGRSGKVDTAPLPLHNQDQ